MNTLQLLPDDCIFELLDRLSLDDLCVFSRTCRRLQILVQQHFQRKYRSEANRAIEVRIDLSRSKLSVVPYKNYVKCFQKFITNIAIVSYKRKDDEESSDDESEDESEQPMALVVKFMKIKCNNIHAMCVEGDMALDPFCKKVKTILCSAQIVKFKDRSRSGVDEATFLTYCPNMTTLILEDGIPLRNGKAIIQQEYRKLEHFYFIWSYASDMRIDELKTFFRHHPNINTVAWMFHYNDIADNALKCLQSVDYCINLQHMFLLIDRLLGDDFNTVGDYLTVLCNRHNFQRLEIEFEGEAGAIALKANSNFLANLQQFTKIHVTCMVLTEMIPALQSLTQLRTLVLTDLTLPDGWNDYLDTDELIAVVDRAQNIDLPFIEEVHFVDIDDDEVFFYILQLVSHWSNLKRIFAPKCIYSGVVLNVILPALNQQRRKLRNSCELTIFTNHSRNETNLNHDLVKVKFVEFTSDACHKYVTVNPINGCTGH